ncbi:hypothetical protein BASA81_003921 [Batrachochytrium salamandrivorans]|nr:hypothetical protein BASA81_003921 [Batrachochytrium salamandrivorans]
MERDELRAVFPRLQRWFGDAQKAKYGNLPLFWQDMIDSLPLVNRRLMLARIRFEDASAKLNNVVHLAQLAERDGNRSPSPDPTYNAQGKRTNTREVRMRTRFTEHKKQFLDEMLRLKPLEVGHTHPRHPQLVGQLQGSGQIRRKIYIPVKDFPGRNFIGLIIGPRGDTQKQLERETGCKIAIRGKGSVKNGRQGKVEDETDELHVIVTGDNEEGVEKASHMVEMLLRPLDDSENEHKQNQLRNLAVYNGTLRETDMCAHCQERGHKQWECPKKRAADAMMMGGGMGSNANAAPLGRAAANTWTGQVVCRHCGERSHPSADCPTLRYGGIQQQYSQQPPPPPPPEVDQGEFNEFWDSLNPATNTAVVPPPYYAYPPQPPPLLHPQPPPPQSFYPPPPPFPSSPPPLPPPPPSQYYPPAPPPAFPEPPPLPPKRRQ